MSNVGALRQHGAAPKVDMEALWRRIVFNILISDTDNHLRNHGFLYEGSHRWRVSRPTTSTLCRPIESRAS
jgi:serine/threonine-protein kinase HipA